ncbi:MAG: hypothetical protein ABSE07_03200 [Methanoregula sp.]
MPSFMYHAHPFAGPVLMIVVWIVQLLIAFLIYRDAKEQKMLAPVWVILAILPVFGYLVDVLYLIIREVRPSQKTEKPPVSL